MNSSVGPFLYKFIKIIMVLSRLIWISYCKKSICTIIFEYHNKVYYLRNKCHCQFFFAAYKVKDSQIRFYFELMVGQDAETTIQGKFRF